MNTIALLYNLNDNDCRVSETHLLTLTQSEMILIFTLRLSESKHVFKLDFSDYCVLPRLFGSLRSSDIFSTLALTFFVFFLMCSLQDIQPLYYVSRVFSCFNFQLVLDNRITLSLISHIPVAMAINCVYFCNCFEQYPFSTSS